MKIGALLPFIQEIDKLKSIQRQTLIYTGERKENSAEHSWHLAMAVMVCATQSSQNLDLFKALKMALLHDLVEIDAGDVIIYGDQSGKSTAENLALKRIMGLLPDNVSNDFIQVWQEFELGQSEEAKFVQALDRFLPLYSNLLNKGHSWKNHNVNYEKVISKCQAPIESALPELWQLSKQMIDDSVTNGFLNK